MNEGVWFDRDNIYNNMWDFMRDVEKSDKSYESILDLSQIHFEYPGKVMFYPMIWSLVSRYSKEPVKSCLVSAIECWFKKINRKKEYNN